MKFEPVPMKPLRIMHVVESFGVGGGVENGLANLIERLDPGRFEHLLCGVFRLGPLVERYPADRARLVCLEQKPGRLAVQTPALARMIRQVQPDIVHSRNWGALEAVLAARWVGGSGVIHSEHGVELNPSAEPRRRRWLRRVAFGLADRVFAVSDELRTSLARRTGFSRHRIGVIRNGVETRRFRPDPSARQRFRREHGITEEEFCIGSVGRLDRIKDYPTLLRALEVLDGSHWRLLIVGDGAERSNLQEFVRSRPALESKVQFLGPSNRVPAFLNAIDVYALPSIREGISNSLLEAMATGLPVVASATGGNPEVVVEEESGLLFSVGHFQQLADRLVRLRSQKELRERLGRHALRRVREQFSLDAMVGRYEEMYLSLARDRGAEPVADQRSYAGRSVSPATRNGR